MRTGSIALLGILLSASAAAQTVQAPSVESGDTWTYRATVERGPTGWSQTHDEVAVTRVTHSTIFFDTKVSGSTQPPKEIFLGADWSRSRDVNGKETLVNRPFAFPLSPGKTWDLTYTEQHPNRAHQSETFSDTYTVVGWESVQVPAGTYRALKIEAEGHWQAQLAPAQTVRQGAQVTGSDTTMVTQVQKTTPRAVTGRMYKAFWYAPEVKRWVKSVEEYYSSAGVRNERYTQELERYKPGPAH